MSSYGTSQDYERGYDDGADETKGLYDDLVTACRDLLARWAENKNLTQPAQAIQTALDSLPEEGRLFQETGREDEEEGDGD
jgi:hypothetical protein